MTRAEFSKVLLRFMTHYDRFLISGHIRPDGDAVGSCTAMALALKEMGREPMLVFDGDPSRYTSVTAPIAALPAAEEVKNAGRYFTTGDDFAFIMLDCSEPSRTGRAEDAVMCARSSLTVDHHATLTVATDFFYAEPETSSTCEILYGLFQEAGIPITKEMAKALFMGVAYDTGGFRHTNTQPSSFAMAAALSRLGADSSFYMEYLFHNRSLAEEKALGVSIEKARLYKGCVLVSSMTKADFEAAGCSSKDADGVVGMLTEVEEAKVVLYLRELEDGSVRVNMRSKCGVDVARIASAFGGGGHIKAAGCTFRVSETEAEKELLKLLDHQLEEQHLT